MSKDSDEVEELLDDRDCDCDCESDIFHNFYDRLTRTKKFNYANFSRVYAANTLNRFSAVENPEPTVVLNKV